MLRRTFACVLAVFAAGCGSSQTTIHTSLTRYIRVEPVIDMRDARSYPVVAIGDQMWMARNMSFPTEPSWCFDDSPADCEANGRLYSWAKAGEACPGGWHLPSDEDWIELERFLGVSNDSLHLTGYRGPNAGARLLEGGDTQFDARLAGYREPDGAYAHRDRASLFWSSTEVDRLAAWSREITVSDDRLGRTAVSKETALSVRCVRDEKVAGAMPNDRGASP